MPVTTLDPNTALIVIDLQKGITSLPLASAIEPVIQNSSRLAAAFRRKGLPVVLVNANGIAPGRTEQPRMDRDLLPEWTEIVPELEQQPSDLLATKQTWGVFASTDLQQRLEQLGVTQVVVTGVATSIGVESTARQAYEAGLNVTLAIDAMTDLSPEAHEASIAYIFPRLGETGTTQEIIDLLGRS
jgi:nicotinamidase-related amidase